MLKRIIGKLREVLAKMGIIKSIGSISEHKDIYINEEMYNRIDLWKALYQGYDRDFHTIYYRTINGKRERRMMTLNMPKVISQEMAGLVFNEKCEISIGDEKIKAFIDDVFRRNKFHKNFQDNLEYNFAIGGMVAKPYYEDGQIKISFVTADCFIPITYGNDGVKEAVFVNEWRKGKVKYTHLEWHLWEKDVYVIKNEVYKSENGQELGIKVPLESILTGIEEEVPIKGLKRSVFSHFKPNLANNFDMQSPLGISLFGNSLDAMKTADIMFDSFNREFRLGKKRIVVPSHMVKTVVDPQTGDINRYFDDTDETYEAFNYGEQDEDTIKDIKVELRVEEHIAAINTTLNLIAMQTGFSSGSFSFDGQSMKTATEVVSEQSKTFKSKKSHETIIEAGLQELIHSILDIAQLYGLISNVPEDLEITVSFDDSVAEDKTAEITRLSQELTQKIIPKKRAIMRYYGLTDEEAETWLKEINEENTTATAESIDFFGSQGSDE